MALWKPRAARLHNWEGFFFRVSEFLIGQETVGSWQNVGVVQVDGWLPKASHVHAQPGAPQPTIAIIFSRLNEVLPISNSTQQVLALLPTRYNPVMSLNLSLLLSPRTFFAAIFGTNPITPLWLLRQPWNKNILNTIWFIQFFYGVIMIGSGIAGLVALQISPISDQLKAEFNTLVAHHPWSLLSILKWTKHVLRLRAASYDLIYRRCGGSAWLA